MNHDEDETVEAPTPTDAQLLADYRARRRLEDDMLRAISALDEPTERSDDDGNDE